MSKHVRLYAGILAVLCLLLTSCSMGGQNSVDTTAQNPEKTSGKNQVTENPTTNLHEHEFAATETVAPTLNKKGYTVETCSCGATRKVNYTGVSGEEAEEKEMSYKILFIGNSYTYYNNGVPLMFELIANDRGYEPTVEAVTKSGYELTKFANPDDSEGAKVYSKLTGTTVYDLVFLQEQSVYPASSPARFYSAARKLDQMIKNNGARTIFYQTWGRETGNATLTDNGWTNQTMTYLLAASYEAISEELGAVLSPVGSAFYDVYTNHPELKVYLEDKNSHPTMAGTYLAALCHYATVYGKSPIGVNVIPTEVTKEEALILQTAAHNAVFGKSIVPDEYKKTSVGVGS